MGGKQSRTVQIENETGVKISYRCECECSSCSDFSDFLKPGQIYWWTEGVCNSTIKVGQGWNQWQIQKSYGGTKDLTFCIIQTDTGKIGFKTEEPPNGG